MTWFSIFAVRLFGSCGSSGMMPCLSPITRSLQSVFQRFGCKLTKEEELGLKERAYSNVLGVVPMWLVGVAFFHFTRVTFLILTNKFIQIE